MEATHSGGCAAPVGNGCRRTQGNGFTPERAHDGVPVKTPAWDRAKPTPHPLAVLEVLPPRAETPHGDQLSNPTPIDECLPPSRARSPSDASWIEAYGVESTSWGHRYLVCIYWAFTTM